MGLPTWKSHRLQKQASSCSASYRSCFQGYPVKRRSTHKVASCVTSVVRAEDCELDLESTWKTTHPLSHLTLVPTLLQGEHGAEPCRSRATLARCCCPMYSA